MKYLKENIQRDFIKLNYVFTAFFLTFLISSCLSLDIKSDFVETKYYNLDDHNNKSKKTDFGKILNGDIFVANFSVAEDISEDAIMAKDESGIRIYHYHRWVSSLPQMTRDYFIYRLSAGNFTSGRILSKPSLSAPNYRIEVRIHKWIAVNSGDKSGLELSVEISLLDKKNDLLLNKIYNKSEKRNGEDVQTIAPAFSVAMNEVLAEFASDVKNLSK